MKATEVLLSMGITPDTYPSDACFEYGDIQVIGTYSEDRQTACIMISDNVENTDNLENCMLSYEIVKEIAYTVDKLITDFGCAVHSYTLKNTEPFKSLSIVKPTNLKQQA